MPEVKRYTYNVEMSCEGCKNAVSKVLNRYKGNGINEFDVNLDKKTVTVETTLSSDEAADILRKTGKKVSFIGNN